MSPTPDRIITPTSFSVAASKIFTYPTRLANAYAPAVQEIHLPEYQVAPAQVQVSTRKDATDSAGPSRSAKGLIKRIYKSLLPKIKMPDDVYILDGRYEVDDNIAHVLDSLVCPVLLAKDACPNITVLLKPQATEMARSAFELLGIPTLCTNAEVVGNLVVVTQPDNDRFYGGGLYSSQLKNHSFAKFRKDTGERIFLSRKVSRRISNESEVENILQRFGFSKVYFEDISVSEQWSLARNAKVLVGIHGAGLSSLFFNNCSVAVIELFHPGFVTNWCRHFVNGIGGTWCGVTGQFPRDVIDYLDYRNKAKHFAFDDFRIDVASLRMALEYVGVV